MKITEAFSIRELNNFLVMLDWIEKNESSIEEAKLAIAKHKRAKIDLHNANVDADDKKLLETHPELAKIMDFCDECHRILVPVESPLPEWETSLICRKHGMVKHLDITPTDYQMTITAKFKKEELDFEPEEIRAEKNTRFERRKICEPCEFRLDMMCKKCGCRIKHRTYYEILHCPIGKW
jgi:hypothetical protein